MIALWPALTATSAAIAAVRLKKSKRKKDCLGLAVALTGNPLLGLSHQVWDDYEAIHDQVDYLDSLTITVVTQHYNHTDDGVRGREHYSDAYQVVIPPHLIDMIGRLALRQMINPGAISNGQVDRALMLSDHWNFSEDERAELYAFLFECVWQDDAPHRSATSFIRFGACLGEGMSRWMVDLVARKLKHLGWDDAMIERQVIISLLSTTVEGRSKLVDIALSSEEEDAMGSMLWIQQTARTVGDTV